MKKIKSILDKKKKDSEGFKREGTKLHFPGADSVIHSVYERMINTMVIRQIMICTSKAIPCGHVLNHKRKKNQHIFPWKNLRGRRNKVRIYYIAQRKNTDGM